MKTDYHGMHHQYRSAEKTHFKQNTEFTFYYSRLTIMPESKQKPYQ